MDTFELIDEIRRTSDDPDTRRRCHDFLVENGRSDLFDDCGDHTPLDSIDTRSALRQVRSAKEGLDDIPGPSLRRPFLRQKLHRVETLLQEHAERNGFDV